MLLELQCYIRVKFKEGTNDADRDYQLYIYHELSTYYSPDKLACSPAAMLFRAS